MQAVVADAILMHRSPTSNYNIPGWSDVVSDKQEIAQLAFLDWVAAGKPRSDSIHHLMGKTRDSFMLLSSPPGATDGGCMC